jgi:hypothetical protein
LVVFDFSGDIFLSIIWRWPYWNSHRFHKGHSSDLQKIFKNILMWNHFPYWQPSWISDQHKNINIYAIFLHYLNGHLVSDIFFFYYPIRIGQIEITKYMKIQHNKHYFRVWFHLVKEFQKIKWDGNCWHRGAWEVEKNLLLVFVNSQINVNAIPPVKISDYIKMMVIVVENKIKIKSWNLR